ncbi:MAG TPA: intradiol ring-cleavage dioxygenase [Alphaproteobacteria bacterium]|nr:intradiol ring-cleavage dioxygenase [Alphaproteobacteria bacterium]
MWLRANIERRLLLIGGGAVITLLGRVAPVLAAMPATPQQTTGPFYPRSLPLDRDNDLARVAGAAARAQGKITHVFGRVLDRDERPIPGARIEIWQCNAFGRYHHPRDTSDAPIDPGFQGYGETVSAVDGAYRFRTIRPVPYPGRTPHIHFAITAPGAQRLVTQMYVAGEPLNARDGLYNSIRDPAARAAVTVALLDAPEIEPDSIAGRFDLVLG